MIERPLDFLNNQKDTEVIVEIKGKKDALIGILKTFDIHINIVLELNKKETVFIKGDNVVSISNTKDANA